MISPNHLSLENLPSLREELDKNKELLQTLVPDEIQDMLYNEIVTLKASEIEAFSLQNGDIAPDFELPDTQGNMVRSGDLRKQGPIVLIFFRGSVSRYEYRVCSSGWLNDCSHHNIMSYHCITKLHVGHFTMMQI